MGLGLTSLQTVSGTILTHNYVYSDTATGARSAVSDILSAAQGNYTYDQADRLIGFNAGSG